MWNFMSTKNNLILFVIFLTAMPSHAAHYPSLPSKNCSMNRIVKIPLYILSAIRKHPKPTIALMASIIGAVVLVSHPKIRPIVNKAMHAAYSTVKEKIGKIFAYFRSSTKNTSSKPNPSDKENPKNESDNGYSFKWHEINKTDESGDSQLHQAVESGSLEMVQKLLSWGAYPLQYDRKKRRPLYYAAFFNKLEIVQELIRACKNTDITVDADGQTALHIAAGMSTSESLKTMERLLKLGANVDSRCYLGQTPLHKACIHISDYSFNCIKKLVEAGANINFEDITGETPLHLVMGANYYYQGVIRFLVAHGADVNKDTPLITPLMAAVMGDSWFRSKKIQELIDCSGSKLDLNKAFDGIGPLYVAIVRHDIEVAKQLIDAGGDYLAKCRSGKTLLELVAELSKKSKNFANEYQDLLNYINKLERKQMQVFLCCQHRRAGAQSPARVLISDVCRLIFDQAKSIA